MKQFYLFVRLSSGKYAFVLSLVVIAIGVSQRSIDTVVRFGSYIDSAQWLSVFVGIIGGAAMAGASALDQLKFAGPDTGIYINISVRGGLIVRILVALSTLFWALALLVASVIMVDLRVSSATSRFEFPGWVYALIMASLTAWVFGSAGVAMIWPSRVVAIVAPVTVYSIYVVTSLAPPNSAVTWFIPVTDETCDPFFTPNPQHIVVVGSYLAFWSGLIVLCAGIKTAVAMATLAHRVASMIAAPILILGASAVMLQQATRPHTAPFFATRVEPPSKPVCVTVRPGGSICVWPQHGARVGAWTAGLSPALAATKGLVGFPTQFNESGLNSVKGRFSLQTSDPVQASGQVTLEVLSVVPSQVQTSCPADGTVFALAMMRVLTARVGATGIAADVGQPSWTRDLAAAPRARQDRWLSEVGRAVGRGCVICRPLTDCAHARGLDADACALHMARFSSGHFIGVGWRGTPNTDWHPADAHRISRDRRNTANHLLSGRHHRVSPDSYQASAHQTCQLASVSVLAWVLCEPALTTDLLSPRWTLPSSGVAA